MCKVIICANQKGGVAKSTSVVNLGIGLANKGKRVLVIDNDPQGSLTEALGYPQPDKLEITLANVMEWVLNEDDYDLKAGILHHDEGIDLMPANIELSGVETSLVGIMSSETTLREYIESVRDDYDYILVDCSPNLGQLTLNALVAADEVIIPVQAAYLPIKGLEQLLKTNDVYDPGAYWNGVCTSCFLCCGTDRSENQGSEAYKEKLRSCSSGLCSRNRSYGYEDGLLEVI